MKLKLRFVAAAGAVCLFASLSANAGRPSGLTAIKNHYYSDASLSAQVGELDYSCTSQKTQWGYQTMYQTWEEVPCGGNGGIPNPEDPPPVPANCHLEFTPYPETICI